MTIKRKWAKNINDQIKDEGESMFHQDMAHYTEMNMETDFFFLQGKWGQGPEMIMILPHMNLFRQNFIVKSVN